MELVNPTAEELRKAMANAVNVEKLRRDIENVFRDNGETVRELTTEELAVVIASALGASA